MRTLSWSFQWTMWKITAYRRVSALMANSDNSSKSCRIKNCLMVLVPCLYMEMVRSSFDPHDLPQHNTYIHLIITFVLLLCVLCCFGVFFCAKLMLTLLSCDRRPPPADVGGLAEVRSGPQRAQSGAALQASAHPAAAAGSRKTRSFNFSPMFLVRKLAVCQKKS